MFQYFRVQPVRL